MKSSEFHHCWHTLPRNSTLSLYVDRDADYTKKMVNVDEDGGGLTIAEGDCNDQMPNVSPFWKKSGMTGSTETAQVTTILTKTNGTVQQAPR